MEFFEAIQKRRSIRKFKKEDIPDELIQKALSAAILAPSAGNLQSWYFIVVKNKEIKLLLQEAAWGQSWIGEAPVVIVVCADLNRNAIYGERGRSLFVFHDTGAAIENLLLAATALELGSVWVGAFNEQEVGKILNLDTPKLLPVALIPLGYPAEKPSGVPRRPLKEVVKYVD